MRHERIRDLQQKQNSCLLWLHRPPACSLTSDSLSLTLVTQCALFNNRPFKHVFSRAASARSCTDTSLTIWFDSFCLLPHFLSGVSGFKSINNVLRFLCGKKAFIDLIIIKIPLYLISCVPGCREASGMFPPTVPLEVKAPPSAVKLRLSRVEKPHNSCRTAENSHGSCSELFVSF